MAFLRKDKNQYGTQVMWFSCPFCGIEYDVCPGEDNQEWIDAWDKGGCQSPECESYDPRRDAEVLFMSDEEIAKEKKVVHIEMLRQRKTGIQIDPTTREDV